VCVWASTGRDPQPVATVQPSDDMATCAMITAGIQANNIKVQELAGEEGAKVAQNVAAGVAGVVIPVLWFGWLRSKHASNISRHWPQSDASRALRRRSCRVPMRRRDSKHGSINIHLCHPGDCRKRVIVS
jgi:hypothetical protein